MKNKFLFIILLVVPFLLRAQTNSLYRENLAQKINFYRYGKSYKQLKISIQIRFVISLTGFPQQPFLPTIDYEIEQMAHH